MEHKLVRCRTTTKPEKKQLESTEVAVKVEHCIRI